MRDNVIVPEKLLVLVRLTVDVEDEPARTRDMVEGVVVMVKSETKTVMVVVWVIVPLVPVTVTVPPGGRLAVMVTVVLFVPPEVSSRLVWVRVEVMPEGDVTLRVTLPLK